MNNKIKIKNDKGEEIEARILFTVEDAKKTKNYIIYTDDQKDSKGALKTYASIYEEISEGKYDLLPISTKEEYDFIDKILKSLVEKNGEKNE